MQKKKKTLFCVKYLQGQFTFSALAEVIISAICFPFRKVSQLKQGIMSN